MVMYGATKLQTVKAYCDGNTAVYCDNNGNEERQPCPQNQVCQNEYGDVWCEEE